MASELIKLFVGRRVNDRYWYTDIIRAGGRFRLYVSHRVSETEHFLQTNALAAFLDLPVEVQSKEAFEEENRVATERERHNIQAVLSGTPEERIPVPSAPPGHPLLAPWQAGRPNG